MRFSPPQIGQNQPIEAASFEESDSDVFWSCELESSSSEDVCYDTGKLTLSSPTCNHFSASQNLQTKIF